MTLVESSFFCSEREDYQKIRVGMSEALFLMSDMQLKTGIVAGFQKLFIRGGSKQPGEYIKHSLFAFWSPGSFHERKSEDYMKSSCLSHFIYMATRNGRIETLES